MKKCLAFLLVSVVILGCCSGCRPRDSDVLRKTYFDSGIVPERTENFITDLISSLKEKNLIADDNLLWTKNEQSRVGDTGLRPQRYRNFRLSRGSCLISKDGTEIEVSYILLPDTMNFAYTELSLRIKTAKTDSPEKIECVPSSAENLLNEILLLFGTRDEEGTQAAVTTETIRARWNRKYLIERFEENAYLTETSDSSAPVRRAATNIRELSKSYDNRQNLMECSVFSEENNGKTVYYMEYTITKSDRVALREQENAPS